MRSLAEIYEGYKSPACYGDKGTIHSYIPLYEKLLAPYRKPGVVVLEIGIMSGHSLRMWEEYFGKDSRVWGIDICDQPIGGMADLRPIMAEGTHLIKLLDAVDPVQVEHYFGGMEFDVVIEDASHLLEHQLAIYQNFKDKMAPDGIYIIEDIDKLDEIRPQFERIDPQKKIQVIDHRWVKGRFDDVLVVIGGKE